MNSALPRTNLAPGKRDWYAGIDLGYAKRPNKTALTRSAFKGPLRVQRPFYPEADGCCHTYLLHPPGGLVIGDQLSIQAHLEAESHALITTPSAGKIYGAKGLDYPQRQRVNLRVEKDACLEWLPQETIVFDSANGFLNTRIDLISNAKVFAWDMVRLGRRASGESYQSGRCQQSVELWRDGRPVFIERNQFNSGEPLIEASWGLQNTSTSGTLFATLEVDRDHIDQWSQALDSLSENPKYQGHNLWGITQKQGVFIARFMGDSVSLGRAGFEYLWREARPLFNQKQAAVPRIWNT